MLEPNIAKLLYASILDRDILCPIDPEKEDEVLKDLASFARYVKENEAEIDGLVVFVVTELFEGSEGYEGSPACYAAHLNKLSNCILNDVWSMQRAVSSFVSLVAHKASKDE